MKVYLDREEWYPVYVIHDIDGDEVDLDPQLVADYRAVAAAFEAVQDRLAAALAEHKNTSIELHRVSDHL